MLVQAAVKYAAEGREHLPVRILTTTLMPCSSASVDCLPLLAPALLRLLHDDMKESGLLPVLARQCRAFNPKYQPRSHAVDVLQVGTRGTGGMCFDWDV